MALTKWQPPALRHDVADDGRVTWLELFFDLVYVAAFIQLGDRLADDISVDGVIVFAGSFTLLWWTWTGTTAFTNRFAVDDIVHRLLAFAQMFAVGNLAVIAATTPDQWRTWLPLAYIGARIPLLIMYWRARSRLDPAAPIATFFFGAFAAGAAIWAVSLLLPEDVRPFAWVLALLVEFVAPARSGDRSLNAPVHLEHFQERYALFTIIVLGETFVKTLSEISKIGISIESQVFGALGFVVLIAIWWTYFDDVAGGHVREESALAKTPARNGLIWVYTHLPLTGAITAFGVAGKKIASVGAFDEAFKDTYTWLLVGALVVILLSVAALDLVTRSPHYSIEAPERVGPRLVAAVLLVPIGLLVAGGALTALAGIGLIGAVMVAQIGVEVVAAQKSEHRLDREVRQGIEDAAGACAHLAAGARPGPVPSLECPECAEKGIDWVQVRWCLTCGHVGCCDDSPGLHARTHWEETGHELIATIEPGGTWAYCYAHDVSDPLWMVQNP